MLSLLDFLSTCQLRFLSLPPAFFVVRSCRGPERGICVDLLDVNAIAKAIRRLAKRMGDRGRLAVLDRLNWDSEGRRLL